MSDHKRAATLRLSVNQYGSLVVETDSAFMTGMGDYDSVWAAMPQGYVLPRFVGTHLLGDAHSLSSISVNQLLGPTLNMAIQECFVRLRCVSRVVVEPRRMSFSLAVAGEDPEAVASITRLVMGVLLERFIVVVEHDPSLPAEAVNALRSLDLTLVSVAAQHF